LSGPLEVDVVTRRRFLEGAAALPVVAGVSGPGALLRGVEPGAAFAQATSAVTVDDMPQVFFSKHLPDLGWRDLGTAVGEMGFAGVDLTTRPGGHVLPERVAEDLPKAVAAIRDAGSYVAMITTGLTDTSDPAARPTFQTAGRADVRLVKAGYYRYRFDDVRRELAAASASFAGLVRLAAEAGVVLAYHNHSGYIGAPVWDAVQMVDPLPVESAAYYFDPRHATVEGGEAGWRVATQLVAPRMRMIAVKDFYWEKRADGRWRVENCPIGEGMVDWPGFFAEVVKARFRGPISMHVEYDPGGRTPVEQRERMMEAAARDRARIAAWIAEAVEKAGTAA
jgi:L-ribulose-5-phosphate 3-epimerase